MTEIMPVPRNLSFTVLPAGGLRGLFFSCGFLEAPTGFVFCPPSPSCLPLTREVASPKGLTEGEIWRAHKRSPRANWLRILSLSRLRRQLPRQREPSPAGGQPAHQKAALSFLTKRLRGAIVVSVRTAAIAGGGRPSMSFQLAGNAAYRYGGRLFLMPEGRYDQRRKTDEHQRVCKHIRVSYHIAHPPFRSRAFLRKRHCGTAARAARDLTGGTMFLP